MPSAFSAVSEFGQIAVGATTSANLAITLTAAQLAAGPTFGLHYGVDFSSGSCTPTSTGCNLAVTFAPKSPGSRADAVVVKSGSGAVITKVVVHGTGVGPLAAFNPGVVSLRYAVVAYGPSIYAVAVDPIGTVYFAINPAYSSSTILKLAAGASTPTTVVGPGIFSQIDSIALDSAGDIFVADSGAVREWDAETGAVTNIPMDSLNNLSAVALDLAGDIFVLDQERVQRVDAITGAITLVAGGPDATDPGDGGPAANADLYEPAAIALDLSGNLFIAQQGAGANQAKIREVYASTQTIQTVVGTGIQGYSGDGGPATLAEIWSPSAVTVDGTGNLYFADTVTHVIREVVAATQIINTVVGSSTGNALEDGVLSNGVQVDSPTGLALDATGNFFFSTLYSGLYEVVDSTPALPFDWPGATGVATILNESITNIGNSTLSVSSVTASGPFTLGAVGGSAGCAFPGVLGADTSCQVLLTYNIASGTANGDLTLVDNADNQTNFQQQAVLALVYPQVTLSPTTYNFGSGAVVGGFGGNQWFTVTNSSNTALLIQSITFTGPDPGDFSVTDDDCGSVLPAVTNCEIDVFFSPQGAGTRSANISFNTNSVTSLTIPLTGSAVLPPNLVPSSSSLNFTPQPPGTTSAPLTVTFTNTGGAILYFGVFGLAVYGPNFEISSNTCVGSLAAGASCSASVTFSPPSSGTFSASISVDWVSDVGNGVATTTIPLSGIGGTPPKYIFVPVTPCRIADTRDPDGPFGGPELSAGSYRTFNIPASTCAIPSTAAAYSLNVTAIPDTELGYLTVWPTDQTMPLVSTLNSDGRVKANAAVVAAGTSGGISVVASDNTNLVLDINGYFVPASDAGLQFYPLTPCRIADTRNPPGPLGGPSLSAANTRDFPILTSSCGVPSTAQAYSLNFTAVPSSSIGFLTAWPAGASQPLASTLNAPYKAVTANASIVPAGTSGDISVYSSDDTDLVIDVNGYFAPAGSGLSFYALNPCRALDTRNVGAGQPFSGLLDRNVTASECGVPASAQAVVVNATVVPVSWLGYLTLWPQGESQPLASTLNSGGNVVSNMAIVPMNNGTLSAYASQDTQLILDVFGYFAP